MTEAHGAIEGAGAAALASTLPPPPHPFPRGMGLNARSWHYDGHAFVAELDSIKGTWAALQPAHLRKHGFDHSAADVLNAAGIPWVLMSTPDGDGDDSTADSWLPYHWRPTIPRFEQLVADHGGAGIAPNAEGWRHGRAPERIAFGHALDELAQRQAEHGRVVMLSTFLADPIWRAVGPFCGRHVALSLEMYEDRTREQVLAIQRRAEAFGWQVQIPFWAAYMHPGPGKARPRTPEEWSACYGDYPPPRAAIIWSVARIRAALAAVIRTQQFAG